jgi:hypothetical protein
MIVGYEHSGVSQPIDSRLESSQGVVFIERA